MDEAELVTRPPSTTLSELKRRLPKVWCPNCEAVQPMEFGLMTADATKTVIENKHHLL